MPPPENPVCLERVRRTATGPAPRSALLRACAPLLGLIVITAGVQWMDLDRRAAAWFWDPSGWWRLKKTPTIEFLSDFGCWPALAAVGGAGIIWLASFVRAQLRPHRRVALFLVMAALVGPGFLVNTVLKKHYGRPRPRDVVLFGGSCSFLPAVTARWAAPGHSFPSGHAAMGFFWLAPAACAWSTSRRRAALFAVLAAVNGGAVGFARMACGAHWLSDIVWSAAVVYFTSVGLRAVCAGRMHRRRIFTGPASSRAGAAPDGGSVPAGSFFSRAT